MRKPIFLLLLSVTLLTSVSTPHPVQAQDPFEELTSLSINGNFFDFQLALAPDNTLYAAWRTNVIWLNENNVETPLGVIYVKRFNGTAWEEVGVGSASGLGVSHSPQPTVIGNHLYDVAVFPTLEIAPDGTPYLAWVSGNNGTSLWNLYIRRFNGMIWEEVGVGSSSGTGLAEGHYPPALTFASDGTPYLAYISPNPSPGLSEWGIWVRRFDGTNWVEVSPGSASGRGITTMNTWLLLYADIDAEDRLYVAYRGFHNTVLNSGLQVVRFDGTTWETLGVAEEWPYYSEQDFYFTLGPDDTPYLVYMASYHNHQYEIFIKRYNGSVWEELGTGSASFDPQFRYGGISRSIEHSTRPIVAFIDGLPYVAWWEPHDANQYTYLLRFNGLTWEEPFPGSASYTGVGGAFRGSAVRPPLVSNDILNAYAGWIQTPPEDPPSGMTGALSGEQSVAPVIARLNISAANAVPLLQMFTTSQPTLTWNRVTWATAYQVQVDNQSDFISPEFETTLSADRQEAQTAPLWNGVYYWRVRPQNGTTWGIWSATGSFRVNTP
jgi:hypothetical protein